MADWNPEPRPMSPAQLLALATQKKRRGGPPPSPRGVLVTRLREVRKAVGLNQKQVANAVGISFGWLSALERGENPTLTLARKLAAFYGKSVDELWPELASGAAPETSAAGPDADAR